MPLKTKKILGIDITISSSQESLEETQKYLDKTRNSKLETRKKQVKPLIIFTPNPEIINFAQEHSDFKELVNTAQINLADGAGAIWAVKKRYGLKIEKVAGVDFMLEMVNLAEKQRFTIGLIGGKGNLAVRVSECLRKKHPKLAIEVMDSLEIRIQNSELRIQNETGNQYFKTLVKNLLDRKVDILFVALGFPKQEYFIENIKNQISNLPASKAGIKYDRPLVLMAVGGSFDYIAGRVPRAPQFLRNLGLEWLFRLIREPWRLKRQLSGAQFFLHIAFS